MSRLNELYAEAPAADDPLSPVSGARLAAIAKQCGEEEINEILERIDELAEIRSDSERDDWEPDDIFSAPGPCRRWCTKVLFKVKRQGNGSDPAPTARMRIQHQLLVHHVDLFL